MMRTRSIRLRSAKSEFGQLWRDGQVRYSVGAAIADHGFCTGWYQQYALETDAERRGTSLTEPENSRIDAGGDR